MSQDKDFFKKEVECEKMENMSALQKQWFCKTCVLQKLGS